MFKTIMTAAAVAFLASTAAPAQTACAPRDTLVETLTARHGERLSSGGLTGPTVLIEVWTGESGSWTILMTDAKGTSCIVAAGQDWTEFPPAAPAGLPASAS
ncbi:hypothetical protein GE300_16560 [Rhodobacteraceae bacterium 2CG4]|uniref:Uncharacterized protein n=1 Tax=Halovulum marinum TaxID=2662447 RepID=A0A6L5Z3V2_9RHOB|nr:hypothetical protein [Halovulum marinum]MSU91197.1 hypothetical protein [Halovulum marinum]